MSKWDKLIYRVINLDKNMRFSEVKNILESMGYIAKKPRSGSSHWTFRKKGVLPITVPEKTPIKVTYIKAIRDIIENEEDNKEGDVIE